MEQTAKEKCEKCIIKEKKIEKCKIIVNDTHSESKKKQDEGEDTRNIKSVGTRQGSATMVGPLIAVTVTEKR